MGRIICFDIETTGLDYNGGDRCIEIGAVEIIDDKIIDNSFHEYINPDGKVIPPESYMVHKISNEFLIGKPKMDAIAPRFLEFIGNDPIVAHNGFDFDFPFMNFELEKLNLPTIPRSQQMDSLVLARNRVFGPKSYSLDSLAKWYGISLAARAEAHGALIDAEILAKVYLELANTEPAPNISEIIAKQHSDFLNIPRIGINFPVRHFPPTQDEAAAHAELMAKIHG